MGQLTDQLTQEAERLATLKKAIAIAQKELADTQQIKYQAGFLEELIRASQQKKDELEKEINTKRETWEKEQKTYQENIKLTRERENDEYDYQLKLKKAHDLEDQNEIRRLFEKEMRDKKEAHQKMLIELEELRSRAAGWDQQLKQTVEQAIKQTENSLKREAEISAKLAKQDADSKLSLSDLRIQNLTEIVKQQTIEISRLQGELKAATAQVKDIAVSAVEGSKKDNTPVQKTAA